MKQRNFVAKHAKIHRAATFKAKKGKGSYKRKKLNKKDY